MPVRRQSNTYNSWVQVVTSSSVPPARYGHAAAFIENNQLLVFGGVGQNNVALGDLWRFDEYAKSWTQLTPSTCWRTCVLEWTCLWTERFVSQNTSTRASSHPPTTHPRAHPHTHDCGGNVHVGWALG